MAVGRLAHVRRADFAENGVKVNAMADGHAVCGEYDVTQGIGNFHDVRVVIGEPAQLGVTLAIATVTAQLRVEGLAQFGQLLLDEGVRELSFLLVKGLDPVPDGVAKLGVEVDDVLLDWECQGCGPFDGYNVQMDIYDRDGQPMTLEAFESVPRKKRIVKQQTLMHGGEPVHVLTEWDGYDISAGDAARPMIFSTYVAHPVRGKMIVGYPDLAHAKVGHEMMMAMLKAQGATRGWSLFVHFMTAASFRPHNLKQAWTMATLWALCLLVQAFPVVVSLTVGRLNWWHILNVALIAFYVYLIQGNVRAIRRLRRERREERRTEAEKKEFDALVEREWA